jgi:protein O-mannosyl-transferase
VVGPLATAVHITRNPASLSAFLLVALAAGVAAAFHNTFTAPFHLDDEVNLLGNDSIKQLWPLWAVLFPPPDVFSAGRPLLNLSFALNYSVTGMSLVGFHVVNLAIHGAAALTLYGIIRRTLQGIGGHDTLGDRALWLALITAALWAIHPVQTNSVTYLSQRAESLMGLFYLLTLYGFIRSVGQVRSWWGVMSVVSCFAGAATKEVIATAPLLVFLYDRTFIAGSFVNAWRQRWRLHLGLMSSWVLLATLMLTTRLEARGVGFSFDYSWFGYALIECSALFRYLALSFWPFPLVFDYGPDVPVPSATAAAPYVLFVAIALAAALLLVRRSPKIAFPVCWFFVILLPTSSVIPAAGQPIAENRVYLPLAGVMIGLVLIAEKAGRRGGSIAMATVVFAFAMLTISRNRMFQTDLGLWEDTLRKAPGNSRAHQYYGSALVQAGRIDDALREFEISARIRPLHFTFGKLGFAYFQKGRLEDAREALERAVRLKPDYADHRANLGTVYFQLNRWQDALDQFKQAVAQAPRNVFARTNLATVLGRMGRYQEAITEFEYVSRLDANNAEAIRSLAQLRALVQPPPSRE